MQALELKVPPVALMLVCAALMAAVTLALPAAAWWQLAWWWAALPMCLGAGVALAGVLAFRRAATTVNPTTPQASSSVVTGGIYAVSRNPMYVGFALVLLGWALWLGNGAALVLVPAFVLYMNRFQIAPEERMLTDKFGASYTQYVQQVRRWL